eukprot:NODE_140_length_16098_cov_0.678605.p1 type:complete len:652 gc:universal NODE_140_length_16098_cov_0.678605:2321-4276(+)
MTTALSITDQNTFRNCLKLFDNGNHKKGLKTTEQLLEKYPGHSEITCTRGLFLIYLERLDEGLKCIKEGLMKNLKSSTNWHIYGIYYKVTRNFDEACKCYIKASNLDENNAGIRRDLCVLLGYTRMYEQLIDQLSILLSQQPTKMVWVQLSTAYFMMRKYEDALTVLEQYELTMPEKDQDYSNFVLFKARIYFKTGAYAIAIKFLNKNEQHVTDSLALLELRAFLTLKSQKYEQSLSMFKELLQFNDEDLKFVNGYLLSSLKIQKYSNNMEDQWKVALKSLKEEHNSFCIRFTYVDTLSGSAREKEIRSFMDKIYQKGSPAFFKVIKHIYSQNEEYYNSLVDDLGSSYENVDDFKYYWYLYSKYSQYNCIKNDTECEKYFDKMRMSKHYPQLSKVDKIDFIVINSKILKRQEKFLEAAHVLTEAQALDTGDRSLNVRKAKYLIRGKNLKEAILEMQMFLRTEPNKDFIKDLIAVQCIWFIFELLKYFKNTNVYFKLVKIMLGYVDDMIADDADFQSFCGRRSVFEPFFDYVSWMNTSMEHRLTLKVFLYLADTIQTNSTSEKLPDDEILKEIFGESDNDLHGEQEAKKVKKEKLLLKLANLLINFKDKNARYCAFSIFYTNGRIYLSRSIERVCYDSKGGKFGDTKTSCNT